MPSKRVKGRSPLQVQGRALPAGGPPFHSIFRLQGSKIYGIMFSYMLEEKEHDCYGYDDAHCNTDGRKPCLDMA